MVVIQATQKVRRYLPRDSGDPLMSDTALGDWVVNRIVVDRQPLLILLSSTSLLAVLSPARLVRSLPELLPEVIGARLERLGISKERIESEKAAMLEVRITSTQSRSLVGTLVDFGRLVPVYLPQNNWDETDLFYAEEQLASTPSHLPGKKQYLIPSDMAKRLMVEKWP